MPTRLVNRCSSRFQSNHHRGYFCRNKIVSSGPKNSKPPAPAATAVVPLEYVHCHVPPRHRAEHDRDRDHQEDAERRAQPVERPAGVVDGELDRIFHHAPLSGSDPLFAQALKDKGTPIPDIAKKLVIKSGKNAGQHPSVASLYRAFAEAEEAEIAAVTDDRYPLRPRPARIRQDGELLTAGEAGLRERLVAQSRAEREGDRS